MNSGFSEISIWLALSVLTPEPHRSGAPESATSTSPPTRTLSRRMTPRFLTHRAKSGKKKQHSPDTYPVDSRVARSMSGQLLRSRLRKSSRIVSLLPNRRKRGLSREKIATHCTTTVSPYPRPHRFYLPKGLEQAQTRNKASSVRTSEQSFFCARLRLGLGGRHVCWPPVRTRSLRRPSSSRSPRTIAPDLTFWLISQSWISTLIIK